MPLWMHIAYPVSFNETVQVRHLDEDDDFANEEDLTFDEYINVDGRHR